MKVSRVRKDYELRTKVTADMRDRINKVSRQLGISQGEFVRQSVLFYLRIMEREENENTAETKSTAGEKGIVLFDFSKPKDKADRREQ